MSLQPNQDHGPSAGAAYPWILEHLLTYPGTYEIPLRTMYTLNATTQAQQTPSSPTQNNFPGNAFPPRPTKPQEGQALDTQTAAAQLRANLLSHISQQSNQPASLPPNFVTSFVRRVFPVELDAVDFPQALTALDYLKDLERRRRREVVAALDRLGVDKNDLYEKEKLGKKYPGVLKWIVDIEDKERRIEGLYTQVYLGLRRWILINEMSLRPFNKSNCLAMLNTLYPPVNNVQPTAQLTNEVLVGQRNGFFRYIQNVEKSGPGLLKALIDQGKARGDETGWNNIRDAVDRYLRSSNAIIDECYEILGKNMTTSPTSPTAESFEQEGQRGRKVDSGISFTSSKRSSGQRGSISTMSSTKSKENLPLPSPGLQSTEKAPGSTLERIAREIRKIKSRSDVAGAARQERKREKSRTRGQDAEQPTAFEAPPPMPELKEKKIRLKPSLKKMRSISALGERSRNIRSAGSMGPGTDDDDVSHEFDAEEMRKRRMEWEAKKAAMQQVHHGSSDRMDFKF